MFDAFLPRDLNTDGLIDFVGTRGNSGAYDGVLWIEQRRSTSPQPTFSQAREDESAQLPPPPKWLRILSDWVLQ
jgi:hypothetical protein